ncbi:MAG: VTC domain-containing protein [Monoraphidium minutum]|nr:MAG: VTC domain-containing protein [Monoraphidium minutum]
MVRDAEDVMIEHVKRHGVVQERELAALIAEELASGSPAQGALLAQRALDAVSGCFHGVGKDALARLAGGAGGCGLAPRVLVMALLHAAAQQQHLNGRSGFGALASLSPFVAAFEAELQCARRLLAGAHDELLARLADLGRQLPPAAGDDAAGDVGGAAAGNPRQRPGHPAPPSPAAEVAACAALRAAADVAAADLVALDDAGRGAVEALAALAAAYDRGLLQAGGRTTAGGGGGAGAGASSSGASTSGSDDGGEGWRRESAAPWSRRLGGGAHKPAARVQPDEAREGGAGAWLFEAAPLTAVVSHSAPGQTGKYVAGVAPDVYHVALHRFIAADGATSPEPALWALSVLHARIRRREAAALAAGSAHSGGATKWEAPDEFQRSTTKYWLRPAHSLRVKAALCRHLPLLVYGTQCPTAQGDVASVAAIRRSAQAATSLVSSVYFDTPDLASYHSRLAKDDGATATRLRWYGPRRPCDPDQQVFVERKTHREPWTGERSVKERAPLPQGRVAAFLAGGLAAGEVAGGAKGRLLGEVAGHLAGHGQGPSVRTEYIRSAWQAYDSNALRVSLDDHLLVLRERGAHRAAGDWCAALESCGPLAGCDVVRFPYGVLEVKLAGVAGPAWVQELLDSGLLVQAPGFSKFLHGSALLFPSACSVVPAYFTQGVDGTLAPATADDVEERFGPPRPCADAPPGAPAPGGAPQVAVAQPPWLALPPPPGKAGGAGGALAGAALKRLLDGSRPLAVTAAAGAAAAAAHVQPGLTGAAAAWAGPPAGAAPAARSPFPTAPFAGAAAAGAAPQQGQLGSGGTVEQRAEHTVISMTALMAEGTLLDQPRRGAEAYGGGGAPGGVAVSSLVRDDTAAAHALSGHLQGGAPSLNGSGASLANGGGALPYGGVAFEVVPSAAAAPKVGEAAAAVAVGDAYERLSASSGGGSGKGGRSRKAAAGAQPAVRVRVEPKTFFANERTFLQASWVNIGVLVMMTGLGLLTGSSLAAPAGGSCWDSPVCRASRLAGALISPTSVLVMVYALFVYRRRTAQMMKREPVRYDDQLGPAVLTLLLAGVTLLTIVLSLTAISWGAGAAAAPAAAGGGGGFGVGGLSLG